MRRAGRFARGAATPAGALPTLPGTSIRPLSQGNRLQRAYARWAERWYARMAPGVAEQARQMDAWFYSRRGLRFWAGLAAAIAATTLGLSAAGVPPGSAVAISLCLWVAIVITVLGAWLQPEKFAGRHLVRSVLLGLVGGLAGALAGYLAGRSARKGGLHLETLAPDLWKAALWATPILLVGILVLTMLAWGLAQVRRLQTQRELELARLAQQRDAAARREAEGRLKLLQAQVQPHFIFNTLAALQHWVDAGDARASALLRDLTAFLRGSTELLGRERVTLAEEFDCARRYLQIMQARLGPRLALSLQLDPARADQPVPPGLLLTLVENAVEHGIAPAVAGGTVAVEAVRDGDGTVLRVSDDGAGLLPDWRPGVGLANVRERLAHLGGGGTLTLRPKAAPERGTEAVVRLPGAGA